jgi:glycosyltransferase involved in cell wall biosynthesis
MGQDIAEYGGAFKITEGFDHAYVNVSPSEYLKFHFEKFGISNVICIPNSINLSDYSFKERQNFAPNILWVRAFAEIYNPKMAIDVLHLLQKKHPEATLTMVGSDKDGSLEITKKYANLLNLNVTFTGKLSKKEWTNLAQNHDVFINTTHFDNTPVSVLEAIALGLPVVSTNVGGLPFLLTHQKNAFLVNDSDSSEMIDFGVEEIFADEDGIVMYAPFESFGSIQKELENRGLEILSSGFDRIAQVTKELTPEQVADVEKLLEKIEEDDDVMNVFHTMAE